jgi:hypothetical protein
MRYLKTYKIFEFSNFFGESFVKHYNRIKPELDDILLPLTDSNIKYVMWEYSDDYIGEVNINLSEDQLFTWEQIKEEILHLMSFMNSEGIPFSKLESLQFISDEYHVVELYDEDDIRELEDSFKFTKFEMTFCKTP